MTAKKEEYHGKLHIYSQSHPHDDAVIVGDRTALVALRDAIGRALETTESSMNTFTNDGEGYSIFVRVREDDNYYNRVSLPYNAEPGVYGSPDPEAYLHPLDPEADTNE